jgi:DNA-directed RNA polymerase subunit RPC12/RpoP
VPSNYLIDHQCPQCGAPATLTETDRMVQCDYCKVKSYLHPKDVFRYMLPHNAPSGRELIYVPYWRFKGMHFSWLASGFEHRFLDTSQKAISSAMIPPSLGLRSQAMKLSFVRRQNKGWFLRPQYTAGQAMEAIVQRQSQYASAQTVHQALIGETLSLIYTPFYADEKIMDAVLNQPVSPLPAENFERDRFKGGPAVNSILFMATICPECGWDLEGDRDTLVLHCTNCKSMWRASQKALKRVAVAHLPAAKDVPSLFLPFWRIQADITGIQLNSYSDLVRQANLPKAIQPDWDRVPLFFWGPAFKVSPKSFLRLTHQVTLSQPRKDLIPEMPGGPMHPVTLPMTESIETLELNLAGIIRPKKRIQSSLANLQIEPKRALLAYLPFSIRHHDLVQPNFNIAVNRNQLSLADNL